MVAIGLKRYARFADGTQLLRVRATMNAIRARNRDRRADIEFAANILAQSPDVDDTEDMPNGEMRDIVRPMRLPWRSKQLVETLHTADASSTRARQKPVRECIATASLKADFRLPSSIRRWMVSSAWAQENEDAVALVSDNAGPFVVAGAEEQCDFAVAKGTLEWGSPISADADLELISPVSPTTLIQGRTDYFGDADPNSQSGAGDDEEGEGGGSGSGSGMRGSDDDDDGEAEE